MKDWKQISFGEIFTDEQLEKLHALYQQANADSEKLAKLLRPWFLAEPMSSQLYQHGLLPSFAVYFISYHYVNIQRHRN